MQLVIRNWTQDQKDKNRAAWVAPLVESHVLSALWCLRVRMENASPACSERVRNV